MTPFSLWSFASGVLSAFVGSVVAVALTLKYDRRRMRRLHTEE